MKNNYILLLLFILTLAFLSYKFTLAYFSDTAISGSNTFTASSQFPTIASGITGTPTPTVTPTVTPSDQIGGIANHIVISEVQIDGGAGDLNDKDFIELYNPTNSNVPLNGLKLIKRTENSSTDQNIFVFTSAHNIASHGYFLWAHNDFASLFSADASSASTLAANNSMAIYEISTEKIIDALSWDSSSSSLKEGTEFSPDPDVDQSMERKVLSTSTVDSMTSGLDVTKGNGYDSDNNAADFVLRVNSQPQNSGSGTETP